MLRTASLLPLHRAFDTGLRPGPFPDQAASLLPGHLAATRTGLPPASDDELTNNKSPDEATSCSAGRTKMRGYSCTAEVPVVTVSGVAVGIWQMELRGKSSTT